MVWHQYILIGFWVSICVELWFIKSLFRSWSFRGVLAIVFLVHCFSHPIATVLHYFLNIHFIPTEVFVVGVESLLYKTKSTVSTKKIVGTVLVANVASVIGGLILRTVLQIKVF